MRSLLRYYELLFKAKLQQTSLLFLRLFLNDAATSKKKKKPTSTTTTTATMGIPLSFVIVFRQSHLLSRNDSPTHTPTPSSVVRSAMCGSILRFLPVQWTHTHPPGLRTIPKTNKKSFALFIVSVLLLLVLLPSRFRIAPPNFGNRFFIVQSSQTIRTVESTFQSLFSRISKIA